MKGLKWILSVCWLLVHGVSMAVPDAVSLTCVTVNADSSVTLTWTESTLSVAAFESYHVYVKKNATSSFVLLTTVSPKNITTYTHLDTIAAINSVAYYVVVKGNQSASDVSVSSDTLKTMHLEVRNPNKIGVAGLEWSVVFDDKGTDIEKKYPNQGWSALYTAGTGVYDYNDTIINICIAQLGYRIMQNDGSCISYSNQVFDQFKNWQAPTTPNIEKVTVDHALKKAIISWDRPPEIDTEGYLIYEISETDFGLIDSVKDVNQLYYIHDLSEVYERSVAYRVEAYDNCFYYDNLGNYISNSSSPNDLDHQSIFLSYQLVACSDQVELTWNNYINWNPGVSAYHLMIENTDNNTLDSVLFSANETVYTYTLSGLPIGVNYRLWIKASNGTWESLSNDVTFLLLDVNNATKPNVLTIDARQDDSWWVNGYVASLNMGVQYILQQNQGEWVTLATSAALDSTFGFSFSPDDIDAINTFRVGVIDACGKDTIFSNSFKNIKLSGEANQELLENQLIWNLYQFWDQDPQEYHVYLQNQETEQFEFKESLVNTRDNYADRVSDLTGFPGSFCYYVQALETPQGNGHQGKSFSNVHCVNQPHHLYVPSAFTVNGFNPIFKPKGVFVELENYEFQIVNRWGKILFSSNDIQEGWDGRYQGVMSQQDVYVYSIGYQDAKGQYYFKTGTVTLLK